MLRKIECFIQPFKLDEVKDALFDFFFSEDNIVLNKAIS